MFIVKINSNPRLGKEDFIMPPFLEIISAVKSLFSIAAAMLGINIALMQLFGLLRFRAISPRVVSGAHQQHNAGNQTRHRGALSIQRLEGSRTVRFTSQFRGMVGDDYGISIGSKEIFLRWIGFQRRIIDSAGVFICMKLL